MKTDLLQIGKEAREGGGDERETNILKNKMYYVRV